MKKCDKTLELPGMPALPKKRGRPTSGKALTGKQRQAKHRKAKTEATEKAIKAAKEILKIYWKEPKWGKDGGATAQPIESINEDLEIIKKWEALHEALENLKQGSPAANSKT